MNKRDCWNVYRFSCLLMKLLNVKLLMSNFPAEIFLRTILKLWLNENFWNYYIYEKKCVGLTVNWKNWYVWNSISSWYFIVLRTLNFLSPMFSGINKNNFSFFGFSNLSFFVFVFTTWKKKIFIFKYFLHWFNAVPSQSTLISQEVFCDYQINLGNTVNFSSNF